MNSARGVRVVRRKNSPNKTPLDTIPRRPPRRPTPEAVRRAARLCGRFCRAPPTQLGQRVQVLGAQEHAGVLGEPQGLAALDDRLDARRQAPLLDVGPVGRLEVLETPATRRTFELCMPLGDDLAIEDHIAELAFAALNPGLGPKQVVLLASHAGEGAQ